MMRIYSINLSEKELRLFSEFIQQKDYSSKRKKEQEDDIESLRNIKTRRGLGRALLHGGIVSGLGRSYGVDKFNEELESGSDVETALKTARTESSVLSGAVSGGIGLVGSGNLLSAASNAGFSAAGTALGLEKNVSERKKILREMKADEASERFRNKYQKDYSKKEEAYLKQLRFENPDEYLREVKKYREEKRRDGFLTAASYPMPLASAGSLAGLSKSTVDNIKSGAELDEYAMGDMLRGTAAGAGVGLAAGAALGGVKALRTAAKYSKDKDAKDKAEVYREKRLKDSNPSEYKKLKEEQKDTVAYMNGMMTKNDFKKKHGHRPDTKV